MERIRILIVEDQLLIAKSVESMLIRQDMAVIGICKTGEEAIVTAERTRPDILLMDVKLQGKMNGIEAATAIRETMNVPIIYLTDYTDAATVKKAKTTFPANYLSKPFIEADLLRAIDIAIHNANTHRVHTPGNNNEFVFLKTGPQTYSRIEYAQIICLEADRAYCKIRCLDKIHTLSISMAAVHEQLDNQVFLKIHRSFVVNLKMVKEFVGPEVIAAGHHLPVSDQHRAELIARLKVLH